MQKRDLNSKILFDLLKSLLFDHEHRLSFCLFLSSTLGGLYAGSGSICHRYKILISHFNSRKTIFIAFHLHVWFGGVGHQTASCSCRMDHQKTISSKSVRIRYIFDEIASPINALYSKIRAYPYHVVEIRVIL